MAKIQHQAEQLRVAIDATATPAQAQETARKLRAAAGRTAKAARHHRRDLLT